MWNSIIAGGATGFTLAVRQGMAPALVSGGIGKVINLQKDTIIYYNFNFEWFGTSYVT